MSTPDATPANETLHAERAASLEASGGYLGGWRRIGGQWHDEGDVPDPSEVGD